MEEKKILLVEDDPDHAELIVDILEAEDIKKEIILMRNGQEAIDYLQEKDADGNSKINPQLDLILLDLNSPKVHGMDVLKFIKKNSKYRSTPVVVLSTSFDQETIDEAYENGANGYITKPFVYEKLVEKIKTLIS